MDAGGAIAGVDDCLLPDLEAALAGLEEEIAILRVRIKEASDEHPQDLRLLTHGINALTKTLAVQYRLSRKARNDLADNLAAALNSLGDQLLPPAGQP